MIVQLAASQTGYPKRVKIGNDYLVAFTEDQARVLDGIRVEYYEGKDYVEAFRSRIAEADTIIDKQKLLVLKLDEQIQNYKDMVASYQRQELLYKEDLVVLNKKVKNKNKVIRYLVIGAASLITGILVLK